MIAASPHCALAPPNATPYERAKAAYTTRFRGMNGFPITMTNPVANPGQFPMLTKETLFHNLVNLTLRPRERALAQAEADAVERERIAEEARQAQIKREQRQFVTQRMTPRWHTRPLVEYPQPPTPTRFVAPYGDGRTYLTLEPYLFMRLGMNQDTINQMVYNACETGLLYMQNARFVFRMAGRDLTNEQLLTTLYIMQNYSGDDARRALNSIGIYSHTDSPVIPPEADMIINSYALAMEGVSGGRITTDAIMRESQRKMSVFMPSVSPGVQAIMDIQDAADEIRNLRN